MTGSIEDHLDANKHGLYVAVHQVISDKLGLLTNAQAQLLLLDANHDQSIPAPDSLMVA
jgi:hypothetical protein